MSESQNAEPLNTVMNANYDAQSLNEANQKIILV
jgi:hypothetical protein